MRLHSNNSFNNHAGFFRALILFYIILTAGLIILRVLFNHYNEAFKKGFDVVSHTRSIIESTDSMSLQSQNLQWESRNFASTGDLKAYQSSISIRGSLQDNAVRVIKLLKGNDNMDMAAQNLQQQITELIALTDTTTRTAKASAYFSTANGEQEVALSNVIHQKLQSIKLEENLLLAKRRGEIFKMVELTQRTVAISNILMLIFLTGSFAFIFYHFSRRQKTERKLLESENRFGTLINGTKDLAIFMIDKDGNILNWYEGAHKIKGYTSEEVIGRNISMFYPPEAAAAGEPERNLLLASEHGSLEAEGWRIRKDGSMFWADVLITAIYDDTGKVKGFTKVTRDFTWHKKAEEKTHQALQKEKELNEIKSNFVSLASHEFRTPLSTILSSVSLMEFYKTAKPRTNATNIFIALNRL